MDDIQQEFLKIAANVRAHLELQRALGVSVVEAPERKDFKQQVSGPAPAAPSAFAVKKEDKINALPQKAKEGTEGTASGTGAGFSAPAEKKPDVGTPTLASVSGDLSNCTRCKLCSGRKNIVFGEGNHEAALVFIGDAPDQEEDDQGRPFAGAAGQLLTDIIVKGMKLKREDVYLSTIVKCRPRDNRDPEPEEIEACEPVLIQQLRLIKPGIIVALGAAAAQALLKTREEITELRGKWGEYDGIPVMTTLHPAYLLENQADKKTVWEDIKKVLARMEKIKKG